MISLYLFYVICKHIPLSIIMVSAFHAYPHTPIHRHCSDYYYIIIIF